MEFNKIFAALVTLLTVSFFCLAGIAEATPPTLTTPSTDNLGANQVTLNLQSSATGTGYFTILAGSGTSCGSGAQVKAGLDSSNAAAFRRGALPLVANTTGHYTVRNLMESSDNTVCFTADDGVDLQATPVTINVATDAAASYANPGWGVLGGAGFSASYADYISFAFAPDGTPYVAFQDGGNSYRVTVMKYSASAWTTVGVAGFSAGETDSLSMAFSPDGTPHVAYRDGGNDWKVTVMKYTGSAWTTVGSAGFSGYADYISMAFSPDGAPYVAYRDESIDYKATVMKYNGSTWTNVGSAGFSADEAPHLSLAFSPEGAPYVAFRDVGGVTVMRYTGGAWTTVGSAGFGDVSWYRDIALAFSPDGVPHVAYTDDYYITVMKYEGSDWSAVGSEDFAEGNSNPTLAFSPDGAPYVAYRDGINSNKATVMKFNGSAWTTVGSAGFSAGSVNYPSLAFAPDGTPHVAYSDNASSGKATVMKLGSVPVITSANNTAFTVGTAGSFIVSASGDPTPALSETGTLPGGVTFTDNGDGTATLSGTPAVGSGGSYYVHFTAVNGVGSNAVQGFTLTVNEAPAITNADHATFTSGETGSFTVMASGFPVPSLGETGALPGGVTFLDNGNGTATIGGSPTTPGAFPITITATNGIGSDAVQSFTLTVNALLSVTVVSDTAGKGGGSVNSDPAGIACSGTGSDPSAMSGTCTADFSPGALVTLTQAPDSDSTWGTWDYAGCGSNQNCQVTMDDNQPVTLVFPYVEPARILSTFAYYPTLGGAYAALGSGGTIQTRQYEFEEDLILNRGISFVLKGGYDTTYSANSGYTTIKGKITVGLDSLTLERITIK